VTLLLGLDTGGTYTDAVLLDAEARLVVAAGKALTTRHDLAIGLRGAVDAVLGAPSAAGRPIGLVSLSTTLATNAIVEGQGSPVCLLLIGYDANALDRAGLRAAIGEDPVVFVAGGHAVTGDEQAPLDEAAVREAVRRHAPQVAAFAVSGFFSVRNPAHERAARDIVRAETGLPVTCGYELTAKLDAPRRALTAALNARLIPQLQQLIHAIQRLLADKGIGAPLMVVKGDGSLIAAEAALARPVETILSGPAASVVGAHFLSGEDDMVVADMGGTTTDVALLRDGRPVLRQDGATVGGWRTMVEAVAVHTFGLGGDSVVRIADGALRLGPRRVVPLSLLATQHPATIAVMKAQLEADRLDVLAGTFAMRQRPLDTPLEALGRPAAEVWARLADGPVADTALGGSYATTMALRRLIERGLVATASLTPSDAAHVLGWQTGWSVEAARLGIEIRQRLGWLDGADIARNVDEFAAAIIDAVIRGAAHAVAETALAEQDDLALAPQDAVARRLMERALAMRRGGTPLLDVHLTLGRPLVAIGAPASLYFPEVAARLNTRAIVPPHAAVCNAVGAVAGGVAQTVSLLITAPGDGVFRVHLPSAPRDFARLDDATAFAEAEVRRLAVAAALAAGAAEAQTRLETHDKIVREAEGIELFLERRIAATAFGRPRIALS
jgi:N-methylhydantoinase A/oxoprolinase/acetone carboxylase beta subunit